MIRMLSVERACVRPSTTSEKSECQGKTKTADNFQNSPRFSPKEDLVAEESKIVTLEKSINFLRSQHELMLRSLHEEIENLRKTNRALQFRLVMCSCSASCEVKNDASPHNVQSSSLENEVQTLKKLLDAEKRRNQSLLAQMEAMQLARSVVIENSDVQNTAVCVAQRGMKQSSVEHITLPSSSDSAGQLSKESASTERQPAEQSEVSKTERLVAPISISTVGHPRVVSPDLKADGPSFTLAFTPRAPLTASDGLWVRRSVPTLVDVIPIQPPTQAPPVHHTNGLSGSQVVPVKLPALRNGKPLPHVIQGRSKTPMNTKPTMNEPNPALISVQKTSSTYQQIQKTLSNESNQAKAARTARSSLGNNSIAVFDPMTEFSNTHPLDMGRPSTRPYTSNLGPFLPALPKTGDAGQVARQRKSRALQRKRLDRTQHLFPP